MSTEVTIRLKITLATEQFTGPDHAGPSSVRYELSHPIIVFDHNNELRWRQGRDREGHMDTVRLPGGGTVEIVQGDCTLKDDKGIAVVTMANFTAPVSSQNGIAQYKYKQQPAGPQRASIIRWVGTGIWEIVKDQSSPPPVHWVLSEWTFNTSAGTGVGGLVVEFGSGTITLTNPYKVNQRFAYLGGGGSLNVGQMLQLIKRLKDLVWVAKLAKGAGVATKAGVSGSSEDQFSTGIVIKNYLAVGNRELTPDDFTGMCIWVDASLGVYRALSGMLLLTHCAISSETVFFRAIIPCGGVIKTPVGLGGGVCVGGLTKA